MANVVKVVEVMAAIFRKEKLEKDWCKIEPDIVNHEPWDLSICREKCQECESKDDCVHWVKL